MAWNNRILVIDDQPSIHDDFDKVLKPGKGPRRSAHEAAIMSESTPVSLPRPFDGMDLEQYELAIHDGPVSDEVLEKTPKKTPAPGPVMPPDSDRFLQGDAWYSIDHAYNGKRGIEKVIEAGRKNRPYAVVFVDVRMPPGIDGVETARAILTACPETEIVIISAFSDYSWEGILQRLKEGGHFHFLAKPFNSLSLKQMAYNCTLKWNQERALQRQRQALTRERDYFQKVSAHAGTVIMEEDFGEVLSTFEHLRDQGVSDLSDYLARNRRAVASLADLVIIREVRLPANADIDFNARPGTRLSEILYPESLPIFKKQLCSLWKGQTYFEGRLKKKNKYGDPVEVQLSMLVADQTGNPGMVTVTLAARPRKQEDYLTDPLTRLPNRELFDIHLDQAFKEYSRARGMRREPEDNRFGLMFMDLNDFKKINDDFGHQVGDVLLREFAERLQKTRRDVDIVSRRGGDEFTLLVRGLRDYDSMDAILESMRREMASPTQVGDFNGPLSTSVGCAVCPDDTEDPLQLIRYADLAMYQAKRAGNGVFRAAKWRELTQESNLLIKALDEGRLELRYQPILDLDGRPLGGQAVPVLNHPEKGLIRASNLIGLAGLTGQMDPICQWVFEMLSGAVCMLQQRELPTTLFLELAGAPLRDESLVIRLETILKMKNLDPSMIVMQFPEESLIRAESPGKVLEAIKKRGFRICLADHNPASGPWAMYQFPFDAVKIEETRLRVDIGRKDKELYLGVLSLIARNRPELKLIGSGIRAEKQKELLAEYEFHAVQGPLVLEPVPLDAYLDFLKDPQSTPDTVTSETRDQSAYNPKSANVV
ncbi:MAG: diguanylate cyclase [Acidobacteriota bacterium]|nr:diguanylate cyclase [Acidobacteriota bacterium]